jgi:uncharacterized protein YrrD
MLRSVKELFGYIIQATDGDIGKVYDFFFDDETWVIRYLIVESGGWLGGRKVLIIPSVLGEPNWESRSFPVALTKDQVEKSPDIDLAMPVHRQHEIELYSHYQWVPYWGGAMPGGFLAPAPGESEKIKEKMKDEGDTHLRSAREILGYHIKASDGSIGHAADFILDDHVWVLRYIIVDTKNWLPGRKVLISPHWVTGISWKESMVHVDLTKDLIKDSPEYDPTAPINRRYEERLYDFYGRPKYWL